LAKLAPAEKTMILSKFARHEVAEACPRAHNSKSSRARGQGAKLRKKCVFAKRPSFARGSLLLSINEKDKFCYILLMFMVKSKDFKIPFTWEKRHIIIKDRVWFLPPRVFDDPFVFTGWDHPELFGKKRPVRIEYCSGNGGWIVEKAKNDP